MSSNISVKRTRERLRAAYLQRYASTGEILKVFQFNVSTRSNLVKSTQVCLTNASETLQDAELLVSRGRYARGMALAILAQEEFAKCFMLCDCASNGRWDELIHDALRDHGKKQAFAEVMLQYLEWFETQNAFALNLSTSALIPVPLTRLPEREEFNSWVTKVDKQVVKKKRIDRSKQRAIYVTIDQNGMASSTPNCTSRIAAEEVSRAKSLEFVAALRTRALLQST